MYRFLIGLVIFNVVQNISFAQRELVRLEGFSQGTTFHISFVDSSHINFEEEIIELLQSIDSSLSIYNPGSNISLINSNEVRTVDQYFLQCYKLSKKVYRRTKKVFDPSVLPLLNYYGFGTGENVGSNGDLDSVFSLVGMNHIHVIGNKIFKKKGARLDFNAIAQGYTVDLMAELFEKWGVKDYLIELGGEITAKGADDKGKPWIVGIESTMDNPSDQNQLMAMINLSDKAIATSGNYRKFKEIDGVKIGHQIDPRHKVPTKITVISATVIADNAALADGYATTFCILDPEETKETILKLKNVEVLLTYYSPEGVITQWKSNGFPKFIE